MKIIISGSTSMIGAALTKQFIENGHEVYALVRPSSAKTLLTFPSSDRLHILFGALGEYSKLEPVEADIFYHFAWAGTDKASRQNLDIQMQNVGFTADALEYAKICGCKKFIGAGSQAEYGTQTGVISEATLPIPETPYGIAKHAAGVDCITKCKNTDIQCIWTRIFSVYGPHDNDGTMIIQSMNKAAKGETLKLSSCEQMWNYLYETDAAKLFYLLGINNVEPGVYNVADDKSRKLKEYVELMVKALRRDGFDVLEPEFDPNIKPTAHLNANVKKLYAATGYKPEVSFIRGIHEIISERLK